MVALAVSADGLLTPEANRTQKRPVVVFQGGIHAGEIDGKDAGFRYLRELLEGKAAPGLLHKLTAVFVPVFNVDGHERFEKNNRPNQNGPEEMGYRVTSQNLNLNRDYAKVDAPEMEAMLKLLLAWDPILYVDLHVTDGAQFEHDVSVMVHPSLVGPEKLRAQGKALNDRVVKGLAAKGHLPLDFYPSFIDEADPRSGFAQSVPPPRFSNGYWSVRNRLGVLVETHSWRPYGHRVATTQDTLAELLSAAAEHGGDWRRAAEEADAADQKRLGSDLILAWKPSSKSRTIDYRGYAYSRTPSEVSGGNWLRYDVSKPEIWKVPLFEELQPELTAHVPKAGFIVPAGYAERVADHLRKHGLAFRKLEHPPARLEVWAFRASQVKLADKSFEGRQGAAISGAWKKETVPLTPGAIFIPVAQPSLPLLMNLLEPSAVDSLGSWGFFNVAFEPREYMEPYVAEEEARKMLAKSPALKKEFEARLASDPAFAKDPKARLNFFYQRHPAYDVRLNLYPVYKVDAPL